MRGTLPMRLFNNRLTEVREFRTFVSTMPNGDERANYEMLLSMYDEARRADNSGMAAELDDFREQVCELESKLKDQRSANSDIRGQLESLSNENDGLRAEINALETELTNYQFELDRINGL